MSLAAYHTLPMYAAYYGLEEPPFNVTPDPRFLYLNDSYQEALAALSYGIEARKGFISLIGEAGTGKTTLLRRLLDSLPANVKSVLLLNPTVSFDEILEYILIELGIPTDAAAKLERLHRLNEFLIEHARSGGNVALLIDEAQDLDPKVLEELRLLSNLETAREKILQIVLAGQPELDAKLADPALRQLRQRITLHVRLHPLSTDDVGAYVRTRLERAGAREAELFTPPAVERVAIVTRGIPRIVNVVCDAALLTAFATGAKQVTPTVVEEVWRDYAPPGDAIEPLALAATASGAPAERIVPLAVAAAVDLVAAGGVAAIEPAGPAPVAEPALPVAPEAPVAAAPADVPTLPAVAANAVAPGVAVAAPEPKPAGRHTLSIPTAATLIGVLAVALYAVSIVQQDDVPQLPVAIDAPRAEAAAEEAPAPVVPRAPVVPHEDPISTEDAANLVEQFRVAYQTRDVDGLVKLFADDASENGTQGTDAIGAAYRRTFGTLEDLRYSLPSVSIAPHGSTTEVRAPFVISYREADGTRREVRGEAEWQLARRDGRAVIAALNYRIEPES